MQTRINRRDLNGVLHVREAFASIGLKMSAQATVDFVVFMGLKKINNEPVPDGGESIIEQLRQALKSVPAPQTKTTTKKGTK